MHDPETRARLGTAARFCKVVVREPTLNHSQICLVVTQPAFSDLRKTNHRYCPTLLVSLDYDSGFPRRTCEDFDPVATSLYPPTPAPETRNPKAKPRNQILRTEPHTRNPEVRFVLREHPVDTRRGAPVHSSASLISAKESTICCWRNENYYSNTLLFLV